MYISIYILYVYTHTYDIYFYNNVTDGEFYDKPQGMTGKEICWYYCKTSVSMLHVHLNVN